MLADTTRESLETVLEKEVQCTEELLATLEAERTALAKRDMAALESTTTKKLEFSEQLEKLDAERASIAEQLGFAADLPGFRKCLRGLPRADRIWRLWQQVLSNVEECRSGNLVNGGILESGRQQVEQALGILRGQAGAPALYTPDGSTPAQLGNRKLGKV
jgi:flagella synthesis protein FlgN